MKRYPMIIAVAMLLAAPAAAQGDDAASGDASGHGAESLE